MRFYFNSLLPGTSAHHDKEGPVAKVVQPVVVEHLVQFSISWRIKSRKSLAGTRSQHHCQGPCIHLFLLNRSVSKVPHPSPKASLGAGRMSQRSASLGAGRMHQKLSCSEDKSLAPSTHIRQLKTVCTSRSRTSHVLLWLLRATMGMHTDEYIHKCTRINNETNH